MIVKEWREIESTLSRLDRLRRIIVQSLTHEAFKELNDTFLWSEKLKLFVEYEPVNNNVLIRPGQTEKRSE